MIYMLVYFTDVQRAIELLDHLQKCKCMSAFLQCTLDFVMGMWLNM